MDGRNGLNKAGKAYGQVHKWLRGATMTAPCALKDAVWACSLVRENGYRAIVLWTSSDDAARATPYSVPNEFQQYRDLEGDLHKIADRRAS